MASVKLLFTRRFITSFCTVILFFIIHLGICYAGHSFFGISKTVSDNMIKFQTERPLILLFMELPFQVLAMAFAVFWMYETAIDVVLHQNVRVLMLSMGYICFVTSLFGVVTTFPLNPNVIFFLIICNMTAAFQQTFHGVIFLIERCVATKWSSTYEHKNILFFEIVLITLAWLFCTTIVFLVNLGILNMFVYTIVLSVLGTFMAICSIALFKISLYEYNKPIQGLSERYQKAKNICVSRAFFVCTTIQFTANLIVTLCIVFISFVFTPLEMTNSVLMSHIVLRSTIWIMSISISVNFIIWRRKEQKGALKFCNNSSESSKVYLGVTGKVVPLTADANEYFRQLKITWT